MGARLLLLLAALCACTAASFVNTGHPSLLGRQKFRTFDNGGRIGRDPPPPPRNGLNQHRVKLMDGDVSTGDLPPLGDGRGRIGSDPVPPLPPFGARRLRQRRSLAEGNGTEPSPGPAPPAPPTGGRHHRRHYHDRFMDEDEPSGRGHRRFPAWFFVGAVIALVAACLAIRRCRKNRQRRHLEMVQHMQSSGGMSGGVSGGVVEINGVLYAPVLPQQQQQQQQQQQYPQAMPVQYAPVQAQPVQPQSQQQQPQQQQYIPVAQQAPVAAVAYPQLARAVSVPQYGFGVN